jgi:putative tricarboxylic transport membrane protein
MSALQEGAARPYDYPPARDNRRHAAGNTKGERTTMTDRVILAFTVVIAAVYLYATTLIPSLEIGDPLGPKAFPRLLGIALLLAAAMLAKEIWWSKTREPEVPASQLFDPVIVKILLCVVAWTAWYYAVFDALGFIVATTLYLLGLMAWFNRGKWLTNVLTAALFSIGTYVLFVTLDVNLPKGILPWWG